MIYAAFPGTGKTFATAHNHNLIDAESSNFQWLDATGGTNESTKGKLKQKNPDWPQNYIDFIIENAKTYDVLTACQPVVLNALDQAGIVYATVAPETNEKDEYLTRYKNRGNDTSFIDLMNNHFESFIQDLHSHEDALHIVLKKNQYMADLLNH